MYLYSNTDNPGSKKLKIDVIHEISVVVPLTFLSGEVVSYLKQHTFTARFDGIWMVCLYI